MMRVFSIFRLPIHLLTKHNDPLLEITKLNHQTKDRLPGSASGTISSFSRQPNRAISVVFFVCMALYFALHLYLIRSDPPVKYGAVEFDNGTFCDEGYKTLDAKNMVLYGSNRWTEADEYPGWLKASPVTVWINYLTFQLFGLSLMNARLVSLFFAAGCCLLFYQLLKQEYGLAAARLGAVIFVLHPLFVVLGRLALFEIKVLFFFLLGIYLLSLPAKSPADLLYRVASSIPAFVLANLCKRSSDVILAVFLVVALMTLFNSISLTVKKAKLIAGTVGAILPIVSVHFFLNGGSLPDFASLTKGRNLSNPLETLKHLAVLDMFLMNPAVAVLALLAVGIVAHSILSRIPLNRLDLLMALWFLLPTLAFTAFPYHPPRYYLLVLPPLVWLVIYAIHRLDRLASTLPSKTLACYWMALVSVSALVGLIHAVPTLLAGVQIAGHKWVRPQLLLNRKLFPALILISVLTSLGVNRLSKSGNYLKMARVAVTVLLAGGLLLNLLAFGKWALKPNYQLEQAFELVRSLGNQCVLVGDWAPQICIDSESKSIYSNWKTNSTIWKEGTIRFNVDNLKDVQPTHLVIVSGINDGYLRGIDSMYPGCRSEAPVIQFPYAGRVVSIYGFTVRS